MEHETITHEMLMWVIGLGLSGLGALWAITFSMIWSIRIDHVTRKEFDALRDRVDIVTAKQATVIERLDDARQRMRDLETVHANGSRPSIDGR